MAQLLEFPRRYPEILTLVGIVAVLWASGMGPYDTRLLTTALAYLIAGIGLNILVGFVGLASVGHAGFLAIGAYAWALTVNDIGVGPALLLVIVATSAVAAIVGAFVLRFRSYYFALATLAFGFCVTGLIVSFPEITGGSAGQRQVPSLNFLGSVPDTLLFTATALAALALLIQRWLRNSSLGLQLLALRGNQSAASSLGMERRPLELGAFVLSAALAGVAGWLIAQTTGFVSPSQFEFHHSVILLVIPIVGGRGWLWAPIVGTAIAVGIPDYARFLGSGRLVLYGAVLVLIAIFFPGGVREIAERTAHFGRRVASRLREGRQRNGVADV